jgi:hypothetical protein
LTEHSLGERGRGYRNIIYYSPEETYVFYFVIRYPTPMPIPIIKAKSSVKSPERMSYFGVTDVTSNIKILSLRQ